MVTRDAVIIYDMYMKLHKVYLIDKKGCSVGYVFKEAFATLKEAKDYVIQKGYCLV